MNPRCPNAVPEQTPSKKNPRDEDLPVTTPLRALAALAASLALGGCTGQYLTTGETPRDNFIETGEVKLVPITPELIANAAASQAAQVPPELLAYKPQSYQIQPGDTLLVTVWDHPEL